MQCITHNIHSHSTLHAVRFRSHSVRYCTFPVGLRENLYLCGMYDFGKLFIIDDNEDVLFSLRFLLEPYCKAIEVATSPEKALEKGKYFKPDVWLADMNFRTDANSGREGFALLKEILAQDPDAVVILMTAYSDTDKAVRAIKAGAADFIAKPWDKDKLLATLTASFRARSLKKEVQKLSQKMEAISEAAHSTTEVIGESPAMTQVMQWVEKVSGTNANVLILGENGTGKDLIAQLLHERSDRSGSPMISIDLGAVPESLFESELFGYEKGAFTDARREKPGRVEVASGGTLFLNEIGNLSHAMQAKLLQVLETRTVQRLGAVQPIPIDVRLICATNLQLAAAVENGTFREDLMYRINTVEIQLPPLRERGRDIILLARHFLIKYAARYGKAVPSISRESENKLLKYHWPGNIRELQHVMERAVIFTSGAVLTPDSLLLSPISPSSKKTETLNLEELERNAIQKALYNVQGNVSRASELLGITRFALYRKMEKFGL